MPKPLKVAHFQRRKRSGNFSVERLFEDTRAALPGDVEVTVYLNKYFSNGVFGRLSDAIRARAKQQDVNHILGDVHYLAWFLPRRRTILTVLDCVTLERLTGWKRHLFWLLWYWGPLQNAAAVTVISSYTRDSLLEWVRYPASQVHVIPPPLCPSFIGRRARRGVSGTPRILQIGTKKNKNIPRLMGALRGMDVLLVVVGELDQEARDLARTNGIQIENHLNLDLEGLIEQYEKSDLLAFVSTYEGFGMPIVEAQAIGLPVVTSNLCSMPETAGDAALLVDPYDEEDIRRAVLRLLNDSELAGTLADKGYENAKRFAPTRIAEAYAELYKKVHSEAKR